MAILLGDKLENKIISQIRDEDGRLIILLCEIQGKNCLLIDSYFPNEEKNQIKLNF